MESCYLSSLRVTTVFFMVILTVVMGSSSRCMEEERNGLLLVKSAFDLANASFTGSCLTDYWNTTEDCCRWEGVVCSNLNNTTTRVTQLWFNLTRCFGNGFSSSTPNYLNASIFLPFEELQVLDLSDNALTGLNGTLRLKKLQALHLGGNELNHVPDLTGLPSLKEVHLYWNPLKSLLPLQGLKLEVLDLSQTGSHDPEYNLSIIWEVTSLKALSLAANSLKSWPEGLCGLVNLEELDVSKNAFHSRLPPCLMNMTSLGVLELGWSDFHGTIPHDFFSRLTSLEFIDLSYNSFQGSFSLASFGNTSKLEVFQLRDNTNQLSIETENPLYFPTFPQLQSLRISNCLLNSPNGAFPSFLLKQHELKELELSHCGVQGSFPNWLLENNTNLGYLFLADNSISGNLDFSYNSSSTLTPHLWFFDVSSNLLQGTLPSNICSIFPNLEFLNMSNNILQGGIPSLGKQGYLSVFDLSSNNFTGELPGTLFSGLTANIFKLSDNNLSGKLPMSSGSVDSIYLDGNSFTGEVSSLLPNNSYLKTLDVSNNRLSGILFGDGVQSLNLNYLVLSNNDLKGRLPANFCSLKNLYFLDLSGNDIGPEMPPCTNVSTVRYLHLQSTNLRGSFPEFLHGASSLVTLDLRGNAFTGGVPSWIGTLANLRVLVLQGNNFNGTIPQKICHLDKLSILDLSANHFSGGIPSCLNNLTFGNRKDLLDPLDTSSSIGSIDSCCRYGKLSIATNGISLMIIESENFVEVNFLSKNRLETYKGTVLEYMSGLDLSSNNLSGPIPPEIGWLTQLHALNLSNNHLSGSIPNTFPNLEQIESLDLSYNTLNGEIPPQLTQLFRLSVFSLAHNNLSGRTPEWKDQFSTFDRKCYEGNPFLCGLPLERCDSLEDPQAKSSNPSETEVNSLGDVFWWSSAGAYPVAFFVTIFVLYLNNYYHSTGFLGR